jgi:hypothetical protein
MELMEVVVSVVRQLDAHPGRVVDDAIPGNELTLGCAEKKEGKGERCRSGEVA